MRSFFSDLAISIPLDKWFVQNLLDNNMIVDAIPGGLILGNRHKDGGIKMLYSNGQDVFGAGEMEGGEFLVNHFAVRQNASRLEEIARYGGNPEPDIAPETYTSYRHYIIPPEHYILIKYPIAIISRAGTRKFLDELNNINESAVTPENFPYLFYK